MSNYEQDIKDLISAGSGDLQRLEEMLSRIQIGKPLYNSDIKYLQSLLPQIEEKSIEEEKPINLEELRKSQPIPKPKKTKPIKFGVSYSQSGRGSAKIHGVSCHNVRRSSQEGDIKWAYFSTYPDAKSAAQQIGMRQPYGWKHAGCCMRKYPFDIIIGAIITSLVFGILGGLVAWYFTRDHFGESWAKMWLILGGIVSIWWTLRLIV